MYRMKTSSKKIFALVGVGAITAGALGLGAWALVSSLLKDKAPHNVGTKYDYSFTEYETDANGDFVLDSVTGKKVVKVVNGVKREIPGLTIAQFESELADGTYDYYLNEKGINNLVKRFFDTANFGPEIFNLKKIWIANVQFTSNSENGLYIPTTNEIGLNAHNDDIAINKAITLAKARKSVLERPYGLTNSGYFEFRFGSAYGTNYPINESYDGQQMLRSELLFQTLMHEYGHHLAYSYMSSPFGASPTLNSCETSPLVDKGNGSITNRWNTKFLDKFKEDLNYVNPTSGYPIRLNTYTDKDGGVSACVGSIFGANQLWSYANTNQGSFPDFQYDDYGFYDVGKAEPKETGVLSINDYKKNDARLPYESSWMVARRQSDLNYYYSQEELFTRKMILSTLESDPSTFNILAQNRVRSDIFEDWDRIQSNYMFDANGKANVTMDKQPIGSQYLADNPFMIKNGKTAAQDIVEELDRQMGHSTGDDISFIFNYNGYRVTEKGTAESETNDSSQFKKVRFGGYFGDSEADKDKYDCVVSLKADGTVDKLISEIDVINFNLGYKDTVYSSSRTSVGGEKYTYITKTFVDKDALKAMTTNGIAFAKYKFNGKAAIGFENVTPMTTFRGLNTTLGNGTASNYLESAPVEARWVKSGRLVKPWTNPVTYNYIIPAMSKTNNGKITLDTVDIYSRWGEA